MRGTSAKLFAKRLNSQNAAAAPSDAPAAEITRISPMTVRTICERDAPIACRIESSRARRRSCTSMSPAMLATAIAQSSPTAANTSQSACRYAPTRIDLRSAIVTDHPLSLDGCARASASWTPARSADAWAMLTPGFMRPTPLRNRASRTRSTPGGVCAGIHTSIAALVNAAGMTPTIVYPAPPMTRRRPTAAGSRPYRRVHRPSPMTTAVGPPKRSSSAVNVRPAMGAMPNTAKNRGATRRPSSRCGSASLVSVTFSE